MSNREAKRLADLMNTPQQEHPSAKIVDTPTADEVEALRAKYPGMVPKGPGKARWEAAQRRDLEAMRAQERQEQTRRDADERARRDIP